MIEWVARALCAHDLCDPDGETPTGPNWTLWKDVARAAIEAMREPTEAMADAADDPFHAAMKSERAASLRTHGREGFASAAFSLPIYRAMIDAALKDG